MTKKQKTPSNPTNSPSDCTAAWASRLANALGSFEGTITSTDVYKILSIDISPTYHRNSTRIRVTKLMRSMGWYPTKRHSCLTWSKGDRRRTLYVFCDPIRATLTITDEVTAGFSQITTAPLRDGEAEARLLTAIAAERARR